MCFNVAPTNTSDSFTENLFFLFEFNNYLNTTDHNNGPESNLPLNPYITA